MHRRAEVAIVITVVSGIVLTTLEVAHLLGFVSELLPRRYAFLLPIATVAAFTIALYLSRAKYPQVVLEGIFVPLGATGSEQSGLFVSNVGDVPALNVVIEPLGSSTFTASFDAVPVVKVGGDRDRVAMRPGPSVRDIFDVFTFLQAKQPVGPGSRQRSEPISQPIKFTWEDRRGRKYPNEQYEIGLIDVMHDHRLIVRKRLKKEPRTLRKRIGLGLARVAARFLRESGPE